MVFRVICGSVFLVLAACAAQNTNIPSATAPARSMDNVVPAVDHHQHFRSPAATELWRKFMSRGSADAPELTAIGADDIISQLDAARIRRAVVLSLAYWFGSPHGEPLEDEYSLVQAENDWTANEAAHFPKRLVAFCSFNPLKDYALAELERCASSGKFKGVKIHLGNSGVDLRKQEHRDQLVRVFTAANARKLPIVIHMWTGPAYEKEGAEHAQQLLDHLLPAAPNVVVQVAHMAGGGRTTEAALAVLAEARVAEDPRTRNLYFDVATSVVPQLSAEELERLAARMRQIGIKRIVYGSDAAVPPNMPARESWEAFRTLLPLSDTDLMQIANNVAPYLD